MRDAQVDRERDEREQAMAEILDAERAATDTHLDSERERSDEALAARDDFLAIVSHDLRGLVSSVAINAAVLADTASDDEAGRAALKRTTSIQRSARRMARLIGDLLDVAAIDAGKLTIVPEPGDAAALVRETVEAFQPVAAASAISLESEAAATAVPLVFDYGRALQVLANLVGNALQATNAGGRVRVRVAATPDAVQFGVTDTGPGIESDRVDEIFERHWQARTARRGLGLGLYIAKNIVDAHGGRIWVESTSGEGSVLCFTLPKTPAIDNR